MKLLLGLGLIVSLNAFASINYKCIADKLQARNSDIYYDLNEADIESMLTIPEMKGHIDAIQAKVQCESEDRGDGQLTDQKLQCIADSLQATNSDIYYDLKKEEIKEMLINSESFGHIDALNAAQRCGL